MRNQLNPFTENLLRLTVAERLQQLEKKEDNLNVIKKQLELLEVINEVILIANKSPQGMVEIIFTDKKFKKDTTVERILLNSVCRVTAYNVSDPELSNGLFRTIIIVDPAWSDNFEIFQCQYGLPDKFLKRS